VVGGVIPLNALIDIHLYHIIIAYFS